MCSISILREQFINWLNCVNNIFIGYLPNLSCHVFRFIKPKTSEVLVHLTHNFLWIFHVFPFSFLHVSPVNGLHLYIRICDSLFSSLVYAFVCVCARACIYIYIYMGKHPHFEKTFTSNHKHHAVLVMFWWFIWHIRALINIVVDTHLKQTCSRNWSTYLMHVIIFLNQYSLPFKTMSFILKINQINTCIYITQQYKDVNTNTWPHTLIASSLNVRITLHFWRLT